MMVPGAGIEITNYHLIYKKIFKNIFSSTIKCTNINCIIFFYKFTITVSIKLH